MYHVVNNLKDYSYLCILNLCNIDVLHRHKRSNGWRCAAFDTLLTKYIIQ